MPEEQEKHKTGLKTYDKKETGTPIGTEEWGTWSESPRLNRQVTWHVTVSVTAYKAAPPNKQRQSLLVVEPAGG